MPTDAEIRRADRKSKEEIEQAKIEHDEKMTNRKIAADFAKSLIPKGSFKLNDLSWYTKASGTEDVNMELSTFRTGNVPDAELMQDTSTNLMANSTAPNSGVVQVNYLPTVGRQKTTIASVSPFTFSVDSAINDAISRLKSQLDKRNSRTSTYANDVVGRYIICAVDGLHVPMQLLGKALAFYDLAHAEYPDMACQFVTAFGFDYADFENNLPKYKAFYSQWAPQINMSVPVIKDMSFITRRLFLAGKCLADSQDAMAQVVVFHPVAIAYLTAADDVVRYHDNNFITYTEWTGLILGTYRALTKGATWKAFIRDLRGGVDDTNFLSMITDYHDYGKEVDVVDEVMSQFHNLDTYPSVVNTYIFAVKRLYLSSLDVRGDSFENIVQGWTPDNFDSQNYDTLGDLLMRPGVVGYTWGGSVSATDRATITGSVSTAIGLRNKHKLINRYKRDVQGSTMIDTRLSALFLSLNREITNPPVELVVDDTTLNQQIDSSLFIVPKEHATEIVYDIFRMPTIEEYNAIMNVIGYPTKSIEYSGIWAGAHAFVSVLYNSWTELVSYSCWFSQEINVTDINNYPIDMFAYTFNNGVASHIDWLPLKSWITASTSRTNFVVEGELCAYYSISEEILNRLNYQAALSQFSVDGSAVLKPLQ